jgi:hypothetical protein
MERRKITRTAPAAKPQVEEPEDIDMEEELDVEADDLDEEEDEEPEPVKAPARKVVPPPAKKVVAPPPAPVKKSAPVAAPVKSVAKPAPKVVEVEEEEEELEAAPVAAPVKKVVVPPPAAKPVSKPLAVKPAAVSKPVVEEVDEEPEAKPAVSLTVRKVDDFTVHSLMAGILDWLTEGKAITIKRTADNAWQIAPSTAKVEVVVAAAPKKARLVGKAYWSEVCTPEYLASEQEWLKLTFAEKVANAKKLGATWESHTDPKIENIRMAEAYREKAGITKYKPEYASRTARAILRGEEA